MDLQTKTDVESGVNKHIEEELDLTNSHLHTLDEVSFPPSLKIVDLTANRLRRLDARLLGLRNVTRLCLRQNLLSDASEIENIQSSTGMESLEIRDNHFTTIPNLQRFEALQYLDVSYNDIRSLDLLAALPGRSLKELFAASNKISKIEALEHLTNLQTLELGSNRIAAIENIDSLANLRELWLGRNRITSIPNLQPFVNLRKLSLQSNRLSSMRGVGSLPHLEELYLSHNGISELEDVELLSKLTVLDVSNNRLTKLGDLSGLKSLSDLWANDNQLESLNEVEDAVRAIRETLTCLYLSNNPASGVHSYKLRMKSALPRLEQLDGNLL